MNNIGFAIKYASQGIATPLQLNTNGSWEKGVVDLRQLMGSVRPEIKAEGKCVILLTFDAHGSYVAIARTVTGRPNDYASGWLYIPADVQISGSEVQQLLGVVRNVISDNDLTPHIPQLEQLFARTYPLRPAAMAYRPSNPRGAIAGRDCSNFNLDTLLGDARYQPCYADYKCVFLVSDFAQTLTENVVNLTQRPLVETFIVMPPSPADIANAFGPGVQIMSTDGVPFNRPMCAERGATLSFCAVRSGYADITFSHRVAVDGASITLPRSNRWLRHIGAADIRVYDKSTRRGLNADIRINDAPLGKLGLDLPDDALGNVRLVVSAAGYETLNQDVSLERTPLEVFLAPAAGGFRANVLLANGTRGRVTVDGNRLEPGKSPLEGYRYDGRGELEYVGNVGNVWVQRALGFAAAVALALIVWLCMSIFGGDETPSTEHTSTSSTETTSTSTDAGGSSTSDDKGGTIVENLDAGTKGTPKTHEQAIAYLKNNKVWDKTEMEQYPDLKGLWDDLNNFRFNTIAATWADILNAAGREQLVKEVRMAIKNCKGTRDNLYAENGSTKITYKTYETYVSNVRQGKPAIKEAKPKTQSQNTKKPIAPESGPSEEPSTQDAYL